MFASLLQRANGWGRQRKGPGIIFAPLELVRLLTSAPEAFGVSSQSRRGTHAAHIEARHAVQSPELQTQEALDRRKPRALEARNSSQEMYANQGTMDLVRLIREGDFEGAQAIKELLYSDYPLEKHREFLTAARNALTISDRKTRASSFLGWWELVPLDTRFYAQKDITMTLISGSVDMGLLMKFSLSGAEMGHIGFAVRYHLPYITRYANVRDSCAYMETIEKLSMDECPEDPERWSTARNMVILTHYAIGRYDIALRLLASAKDGFVIFKSTMDCLQSHMSGDFYRHRFHLRPNDARFGVLPDSEFTPSKMAAQLRLLRQAIHKEHGSVKFKSFLADFIYGYRVILERRRALDILRRRVVTRIKRRSILALWVDGEMAFYIGNLQHIAALRVFAHYYQVPHSLADIIARIFDRQREAGPQANDGENGFANSWQNWVEAESSLVPLVGGRLWPGGKCLHLMWKALALLVQLDELEQLYRGLVVDVKAAMTGIDSLAAMAGSGSLTSTSGKLDASMIADDHADNPAKFSSTSVIGSEIHFSLYFQTFVVAFGKRVGPRRALAVISDMVALGLQVDMRTWGFIVSSYAGCGDVDGVNIVLKHIKNTFSERTTGVAWRRQMTIIYEGVIRGYLKKGRLAEAHAMKVRMERDLEIKAGENQRIDTLLLELSSHEGQLKARGRQDLSARHS